MAVSGLMYILKQSDQRHKQRAGNVPFQMAAVMLQILGKGDQIVVFFNHICGIVRRERINNADHGRGIVQRGDRVIIALKISHRLIEAQLILRGHKQLFFTGAPVKQSDRQKLPDRNNLTVGLIISEVTGTLAVGFHVARNDIFIVKNGTER